MQPPFQQFPPYQHMSTNTTKYPSSLKLTQPAHGSNPYETTEPAYLNPYMGNPYELPPPPPKHKTYKWLYVLLLVVVAITPVVMYRIIYPAVPVTVTTYHTLVVTPTPHPTYNVTDPGLSMNEVSGKQIWECTLANLDIQGTVHTNITFKSQSPDITAYECERAENVFPNTNMAAYANITGSFPNWCKGVTKDGATWSVTSEYSHDAIPECKVLASW